MRFHYQKTLERESRKYDNLWRTNYRDANWQHLARSLVRKVGPNTHRLSLVDFGFGSGNTLEFFKNRGFYVEGVDISSYVVAAKRGNGVTVHHASLDNLHFLKDNQFTIGFCNDVLEHIPTEYVEKSLEELARTCCNYLFISICPKPANRKSLEGENLHLTVRSKTWWKSLMNKFGKTTTLWPYVSRSGRYMIELKPTR